MQRRHMSGGDWALLIYAGILGIIGLILAIGGLWLIAYGGTVYYLLAGVGLLISAYLLFRERMAGFWAYAATYLLTVIWGLAEAGFHAWALIPWVVGPTILLIVALLFVPLLRRARARHIREEARP